MTALEVYEKIVKLEAEKTTATTELAELKASLSEARKHSEWTYEHHELDINNKKSQIEDIDLKISGYKYRLQKVRVPKT